MAWSRRLRTRSLPRASIVSKMPGVAVRPVIATLRGINTWPALIPIVSARLRKACSIASWLNSLSSANAARLRCNITWVSSGVDFFCTRSSFFGTAISSLRKKSTSSLISVSHFNLSCTSGMIFTKYSKRSGGQGSGSSPLSCRNGRHRLESSRESIFLI